MTETELLALRTLFMAAVVVAGLSLSYVPHVELVTLVVFTAGVALGSRGGAGVGAAGMVLYVFANSALKGFPPSPLPILAAQALAASLPGLAGGWWRRWWLSGGAARVWAIRALPLVGLALAAAGQAILNLAFAYFLAGQETGRLAVFVVGMTAGLLDMGVNGILFAVAGPRVVSTLRRLARDRGWWRAWPAAAVLAGLILAGPVPRGARASDAPPDAPADTVAATETEAGERSAGPVPRSGPLRPLRLPAPPLWQPMNTAEVPVRGLPSLRAGSFWTVAEPSLTPVPALSPALESWGLGWGRTRFAYDGLPLAGPVHDDGEPPDLPLAWRGTWREKWTATGTSLELAAPAATDQPLSQISLTTGSLGRRTADFALFRNLGPVNLGVDFGDREEQGLFVLNENRGSRIWMRLESVTGRRPDWSLDVSSGNEELRLLSGVEFERVARRIQGSMRGPFLGGQTRVALQARRRALQIRRTAVPVDELLLDGFTLQADWAAPGPAGLTARLRWDQDRRRGVLAEDRSFRGLRAGLSWSRQRGAWEFGAEAEGGRQEPYGTTWEAAGTVGIDRERWGARLAVSHEENLPAMVLGLDRAYPEYGLAEHLERFETAADPEVRTGARVEGAWRPGRLTANLGGWFTALRHYRIESNPLWLPVISPYAPAVFPERDAEILGAYGELRLDLGRGWGARGTARVHDRDALAVPYLPSWYAEGSLHWRRPWFSGSMDLDASLGGALLGPRRTPGGELYPTGGLGHARLVGRVDNGVLTLGFENLLDVYLESDFRDSDVITPLPVAGRTFLLGLTLYLTD